MSSFFAGQTGTGKTQGFHQAIAEAGSLQRTWEIQSGRLRASAVEFFRVSICWVISFYVIWILWRSQWGR